MNIEEIDALLKYNPTKLKLDGLNCPKELTKNISHVAEILKTTTTLKSLTLKNYRINDKKMEVLRDSLIHNKTLTKLNLSRNSLYNNGIEILSHILENNTNITELNVSCNYFTEGLVFLSEALKKNKTLKTLKLSDELLPTAFTKFAKMLEDNNTLTYLSFKNVVFGARGMEILCNSLRKNKALTCLELHHIAIGLEICKQFKILSEFLETNNTLTSLILSSNYIPHTGLISLTEALKKNNTLVKLDLSEIFIERDDLCLLKEILEKNYTLRFMRLFGNESLYEKTNMIKAIYKLLERNTSYHEQRKLILLSARELVTCSPFHKNVLPLDIFKTIYFSIFGN